MTPQEYNRDVKRLRKLSHNVATPNDAVEQRIKAEFHRLYNADDTFKYANKDSVLTLLRINLRFRFIPLHSFGLFITL